MPNRLNTTNCGISSAVPGIIWMAITAIMMMRRPRKRYSVSAAHARKASATDSTTVIAVTIRLLRR